MHNRIAYLERREVELTHEEASTPKSGHSRPHWLKVCRELEHIQEELAFERWAHVNLVPLEEPTTDELAFCEEYARHERALKRRKRFRLV